MTTTKWTVPPPATDDHQRVVDFLRHVKSDVDTAQTVEVIETHISWVFLAKHLVYKLKKPVKFDFLDFSTPELREAAVRDEVRLNRRLAGNVYLDAIPITLEPNGVLRIGGKGRVLEWVVKMRRLPADRMLDELIRTDRLTAHDIRCLSETLAQYYSAAPPLMIRPSEYRRELEEHLRGNRNLLNRFESPEAGPLVKRIHTAQLRTIRQRPDLFDDRVRDGRIIDGHGDLRPEHICLTSSPVIFDCIEFNSEFRQIDVLDELCFLAMECDQMGADGVGEQILAAYKRKSNDQPADALVRFYKSYRACVRAKVAWLRLQQAGAAVAQQARELTMAYLRLADRYLAPIARPCLLVICGVSGSGKSTLASELASDLEMDWLRTDSLRLELFGPPPQGNEAKGDRYSLDNRQRVYSVMLSSAEKLLASGVSAILDGAFLQTADREAARQIAVRHGADFKLIHCVCSLEVARDRVQERLARSNDPSEATPDLVDVQLRQQDRFTQDAAYVEINTTDRLSVQTGQILQALATPR